MSRRRPIAVAVAVWPVVAGLLTGRARADASFDPSALVDPNVDGASAGAADASILPIILVTLVAFALLLLVRTRGISAVATLLTTAAGLGLGALFIAAGLFSDWSGRHEVYPIPILLGVAIIAVVLVAAWRGRRSRPLPVESGPVEEHPVA